MTMNSSGSGRAGLLIQSLAIFVALSIVLGRIYFLTYFNTLGIPASEVHLNVLDYSIISPDTAILGVGVAVVFALNYWLIEASSQTTFRKDRILLGFGLVVIGIILELLDAFVFSANEFQNYRPGSFGLQKLLTISVLMTGASIVGTGLPSMTKNSTDRTRNRTHIRLLLPILLTVVAVTILSLGSSYAVMIGKSDAQNVAWRSPEAVVEVISNNTIHAACYDSAQCSKDCTSCVFHVVLLGRHFTYVKPVESGTSQNILYAIPIEDITGITYVSSR